tara:strand:- start:301 stop:1086 length:786 start_codon:yes stop_codon:yes gene_type:complete
MSVKWRKWVMDDCRPGNNAKWVLFVMADAVDEHGLFYRGTRWLAQRADIPERTVQKKIKYLIQKGFIRRVERTARGRRATYLLTELTHAESADVNQNPTHAESADVTHAESAPTHAESADASHYKNNLIEPNLIQTINNHPLPSPNGGEILPKNTTVNAENDDDGNKNKVINWINNNYPDLINTWKRDFKAPPSATCLRAIYAHREKLGDGFPAAHIGFMKSQNVTTPDIYLVKRIRGRAPLLVRDIAAQKTTHDINNRMI